MVDSKKSNKFNYLNPLEQGIAYDDVLLVPKYSEVLPSDVNLSTNLTSRIKLKLPILSAAMDTVTEADMAISLASEGGMGIIHKNMSIEEQSRQIRIVKKFESGVISDPVTARPDMTVGEIYKLTKKYRISGVPVVDKNKLVGIVTNRDLRFVEDENLKISKIMTPQNRLITVNENFTKEEVISSLKENRIEKLLITNSKFELKGMITFKDLQKSTNFPNASKDSKGRLIVVEQSVLTKSQYHVPSHYRSRS